MTEQEANNQPPTETIAATATPPDLEKGSNGNDNSTGEKKKGGVRTGDKSGEQIVLPKNRIILVFIGLMLTVFLSALDQTIVCMASLSLIHRD
jgi:hypothetical protein